MKVLSAFLFIFLFAEVQAQSLSKEFTKAIKLIPLKHFTDLNSSGMDSLLQYGSYVVPGGNEEETTAYHMEMQSENCIMLTWSFTTGQRGFNQFHIGLFEKDDGGKLLAFLSSGGAAEIFQIKKLFFDFDGKTLTPSQENYLPKKFDSRRILKAQTPDSVRSKLNDLTYSYYHLDCELNAIVYSTSSALASFNWIENFDLVLNWNGLAFEEIHTYRLLSNGQESAQYLSVTQQGIFYHGRAQSPTTNDSQEQAIFFLSKAVSSNRNANNTRLSFRDFQTSSTTLAPMDFDSSKFQPKNELFSFEIYNSMTGNLQGDTLMFQASKHGYDSITDPLTFVIDEPE